ncbi:conjugal transfer protein TraH [Nitrosomonas mobilis]|jgi:conjugative transfer pilus assembly protein TraH|uniref:Putative TraH family protein n=1 Tax=Nitrosomonas mobilis TaxID=51642 RepID=A0A1G5SCV8_9PROT|nr:conjugal transfer protein TraH [Nitrosomonas mobilis]SCZ85036.1 putative TraH family protein [Nitrosomonas mobilis]HNO75905.1 conjugal transfer protein TraH [Nitrosomonas mobilis]
MIKARYLLALLLTLQGGPAFANISSDMQSWFDSMGAYSNITTPQAVQGQTGSFYTGGSLYMRTPVTSYQLGSLAAPTFRAGCGGIDIHAGSFSFINTQQFTALLRNIANNALGYAFMIAVQTISPDLADLMKSLQNAAQSANSLLNMNSCRAAEALIGMTSMPQMAQKAKEQVNAQSNGSSLINKFTDSLDGLSKWAGDFTTRKATLTETSQADPLLKNYLNPGNVAWKAMSNLNAPDHIKELMMSLVGTIIVRATGDAANTEPQVLSFGKILEFKDLVGNVSQSSKTIKVWRCTSTDCDNLFEDTITITPFAWRVREIIRKGTDKIYTRDPQGFTDTDTFFLTQSTTPLWKLLSMSATVPFSQAALDEYAEIIATEVSANFANTAIREMNKALVHAQGGQDPASTKSIEKLQEDAGKVRTEMAESISLAYQKGIGIAEQARNLQMINQTMMSAVSNDLRNSLSLFNSNIDLK